MPETRTMLWANNAITKLAGALAVDDLTVSGIDGSVFPSPQSGEVLVLAIEDLSTRVREVVYCTSRSSGNFTIERGKEGTTPAAFSDLVNTVIQNCVTAGTLEYLARAVTSAAMAEIICLKVDISANILSQDNSKSGGRVASVVKNSIGNFSVTLDTEPTNLYAQVSVINASFTPGSVNGYANVDVLSPSEVLVRTFDPGSGVDSDYDFCLTLFADVGGEEN